jgi:hypothetical protein
MTYEAIKIIDYLLRIEQKMDSMMLNNATSRLANFQLFMLNLSDKRQIAQFQFSTLCHEQSFIPISLAILLLAVASYHVR